MRLFIVSDTNVHVLQASGGTIGSSTDDTVTLRYPGISTAQLIFKADAAGRWSILNDGMAVEIGGRVLAGGEKATVVTPAQVRIGSHIIELRDARESGALHIGLRQRMHEAEVKLHVKSVEALRRLEPGQTDNIQDSRIRESIAAQVESLLLPADFETWLASVAVTDLLINRIHGLKRETARGNVPPNFDRVVDLLATTMRLQEENTAAGRVERVLVLCSWSMSMCSDLFDPGLRRRLARYILAEHLGSLIHGLGPLDALRTLDGVNDIMVLPSGAIYIDRHGAMQDSGRRMLSAAVSQRIVERIVGREGRRIDQSRPMVDARTDRGDRLNAVISPLSVEGPALTLRSAPERRLTLEDMVSKQTLTREAATFLGACIVTRRSLVISGGTGSGKTTLLRELAQAASETERIVTIEDTAELMLNHPHVVPLQTRPANLEGHNAITIRDLVKNALRMRPDRIIVGECRGGEALDMLQAMNTGHDGSMTTVHANSPTDALLRLETMALQAEDIDLPSRVLRQQIASAVDVLVQVQRRRDGVRSITSICEVLGVDEDDGTLLIEEIYSVRLRKSPGRRMKFTRLSFTGYVPTFFEEMMDSGAVDATCLR
jgi:Flp pilus assembly CpaF family ATPase